MHVLTGCLFILLTVDVGQCSCRDDPAFDKNEIVEKIESCKSAIDQFECVDDFGVKPANLLLNFGYSVGFIERFGVRLNVSQSAHELYQNCTRNLLDAMPDYFSIEVQKLMNSQHYDGKCFTRDQLCSLNRVYLYPFICLARRQCSAYLTEAYYSLVHANQQLSLETNEQLGCSEHHDQDLKADVYKKGFEFTKGQVIHKHFCRNVPTPPRRVILENHLGGFRVTIGLEYHW